MFNSWLPLNKTQSADKKREFTNRLNEEVFLPTCYVDDEGDLSVSYVMPYHCGLIAGQFMAMTNRFASLLDYLVNSQNQEGLIRFDDPEAAQVLDMHPKEKGTLLN